MSEMVDTLWDGVAPSQMESTMKPDFTSERFSEDDLRHMRKQIDSELKARVARRLTPKMRRQFGAYANRVKVRVCKGCGEPFTARMMRSHPCSITYTER